MTIVQVCYLCTMIIGMEKNLLGFSICGLQLLVSLKYLEPIGRGYTGLLNLFCNPKVERFEGGIR